MYRWDNSEKLVYVRVAVINFSWSRWFVTHRIKLEEVEFVDEEFQDKKVNNKDFYMWIIVCYRRYSRRCMQLRQFGLSGVRNYRHLTALN